MLTQAAKKLVARLNKGRAWLLYTLVVAVAYLTLWGRMSIDIHLYEVFDLRRSIDLALDLAAFLLLCSLAVSLMPRRGRALPVLGIWLVTIFCFVNSVYSHFFEDALRLNTIGHMGALDTITMRSALYGLMPSDIIYIVVPVVVTIIYLILRRHLSRWRHSPRRTLSIAGCLLALLVLTQCKYLRREIIFNRPSGTMEQKVKYALNNLYTKDPFHASTDILTNGLPVYVIKNVCKSIFLSPPQTTLTDADRAEAAAFINRRRQLYNTNDSLKAPQNLILIIVESLNDWVTERSIDGQPVTPLLDSLLRAPGVVGSRAVRSQVRLGSSSDGQLMYNTGLMPPDNGQIAVYSYLDRTYPALAKEIKPVTAYEVIWENPHLWNHNSTNKAYGYDGLVSVSQNIGKGISVKEYDADRKIFDTALTMLDTIATPFMLEITTVSTHFPFGGIPEQYHITHSNDPTDTPLILAYLSSMAYLDKQLRRCIDTLRQYPWFDDTLIVIAGDHDFKIDEYDFGPRGGNTIFIALNSGRTKYVEQMRQIDVYPTILALMGLCPTWPGVGTPITADTYDTPPPDTDSIDRLSTKLLTGRYFD